MARGTRLDRADWSTIQHASNAPSASTKGNMYIDDVSGNLYVRAENDSWQLFFPSLWQRNSDVLSPLNSGDGLDISATGTNEINIEGDSGVVIESNIYNLQLLSSDSSIELKSSGTQGDITIATDSSVGDILIDAVGTSGDLSLQTGGNNGEINITSAGGVGGINLSSSTGTNAGIHCSTGGNGAFDITSTSSDGSFSYDGSSSGLGNATFILPDSNPGSSGILSASCRLVLLNAKEGLLLTNADLASDTGFIQAFSDNGGGEVEVNTGPPHGLHPFDPITIINTTNYNSSYVVKSIVDSTHFIIDATFVSTEIGDWVLDKTIGDYGPAFISLGDESGNDPLHIYSSHSDILIETKAATCSTDIVLKSCDNISCTSVGDIDLNADSSVDLTSPTLNLSLTTLNINGTPGYTGTEIISGIQSITVEDGIVTAITLVS